MVSLDAAFLWYKSSFVKWVSDFTNSKAPRNMTGYSAAPITDNFFPGRPDCANANAAERASVIFKIAPATESSASNRSARLLILFAMRNFAFPIRVKSRHAPIPKDICVMKPLDATLGTRTLPV